MGNSPCPALDAVKGVTEPAEIQKIKNDEAIRTHRLAKRITEVYMGVASF